MIEIVSHPVALIGGGYAMCYGVTKFINRIQPRPVEKKQSLSKASVEELELWHSLWTHPDVSVTFYQWSEEDGFVERPLDIVVKLLLDWDNRTPSDRWVFQTEINDHIPRDQVWGHKTYRAVVEYGIWNAVELMDSVSKARVEAKRVPTGDYSAPLLRGTWRVGTFERSLCNGRGAHVWYRNSEDGFVCDCGVRSNFLPGVDESSSELSSLKRRAKKLRLDIINASNAGMKMHLLRRYKELMEEIERYS